MQFQEERGWLQDPFCLGTSLAHRKVKVGKIKARKLVLKALTSVRPSACQDTSEKDITWSQLLKDVSSSLPLHYCGCCTTWRSSGCGVVEGSVSSLKLLPTTKTEQLLSCGRLDAGSGRCLQLLLAAWTVVHSSPVSRGKRCRCDGAC